MKIQRMWKNIYNSIIMEQTQSQKKLYTTCKRDKIFNVRKLPYKQFDNQKYLKSNYSPLLKKQTLFQTGNKENTVLNCNHKNMEYHFQVALTTSPAYKELQIKYKEIRDNQKQQKLNKLKILKEKEDQLEKYILERRRLENETERLLEKRDELRNAIQLLRERREAMRIERIQRDEEQRLMNMANLRNMMMEMYYQGGVELDPDNMTYQELLQLQQKIGKVSKGINEDQYNQLERQVVTKKDEEEMCSICYENVKEGEQINKLKCGHLFHCDCIKEWLMKERVCPLCKQELLVSPSQVKQ